MATRIKFHQSLDELKERLLIMAGMAEQAIQRSIEAYTTRDLSICELVFRSEPAINRLEREIDQMALDLLAMEQPMAIDLRFILAVIKINHDLERIGDQSVGLARRTRDSLKMDFIDLPVDLGAMGEYSTRMIRTAIQALLEGDARLADSVRDMDDEIDRMNRRAITDLLSLIQERPNCTQQAMNGLFVARSLERISDHACNIASDVIFWVRGADVRHQLSLSTD